MLLRRAAVQDLAVLLYLPVLSREEGNIIAIPSLHAIFPCTLLSLNPKPCMYVCIYIIFYIHKRENYFMSVAFRN